MHLSKVTQWYQWPVIEEQVGVWMSPGGGTIQWGYDPGPFGWDSNNTIWIDLIKCVATQRWCDGEWSLIQDFYFCRPTAATSTVASPFVSRTRCCLSWRLCNPAQRPKAELEIRDHPWRVWRTRGSGWTQGTRPPERGATARWTTQMRRHTRSLRIMRHTSFPLLRILCVFDRYAMDGHCRWEITAGLSSYLFF